MAKQTIRSIRKGSVQWNEEDRLSLGALLLKCGYTVKFVNRAVPGQENKSKGTREYIVEFWEENDD